MMARTGGKGNGTSAALFALLAAIGVSGCGPTENSAVTPSQNVPQKGLWRVENKITEITVNHASVTRTQLPVTLPADQTTEACIAPALTTKDQVANLLQNLVKYKCEMTSFENNNGTITGDAKCLPTTAAQNDSDMEIKFTGHAWSNSVELKGEAILRAKQPTGNTERYSIGLMNRQTRLGDC